MSTKSIFLAAIRRLRSILAASMAAADRSYRKSNQIHDRVSAGKEAHMRAAYRVYHDSI